MQLGLTEAFLTWTAPSKATDDIIQLFSQAIHEWMCKTAAPFFLFNIGFNSQITHSVPKCVWVSLPAEVCVVLVFLLRSAALRLFLPSVSLTLICFCLFLCHVYFSLICCFSCCRNIFERKKWGNEFKNSLKPASYALVLSSTSASYTHWWLRMFQSLFLHQSRANTCVYPMLYLACLRHVLTAQHTRPSKTRRVFNTLLVPHPRHKPDTASASH